MGFSRYFIVSREGFVLSVSAVLCFMWYVQFSDALSFLTLMSKATTERGNKGEKDYLLNDELTEVRIKGKLALPPVAKNNLYKTRLCRNYMSNGKCKYGRVCQFAHGKELEKYSSCVCSRGLVLILH